MTGSRRTLALVTAGILALTISACAPEPEDVAGAPDKGGETQKGEESRSWQAEVPDEAELHNTELPSSFPSEFVIPEGAVISDTGEREEGVWFLVLEADNASAASELWQRVIGDGGFTVSDEGETPEGGVSAMLSSASLEVQALTMPQPDGTVLLSYDIASL